MIWSQCLERRVFGCQTTTLFSKEYHDKRERERRKEWKKRTYYYIVHIILVINSQ